MNGPAGILAGLIFVEEAARHPKVHQDRPRAAAAEKKVFSAAADAFDFRSGQGRNEIFCRRIADKPRQGYVDSRDALMLYLVFDKGTYRFYFRQFRHKLTYFASSQLAPL